jgi:peptidoglycan/xylan/chitin deacetylase (PgdA/CDA1 family)
VALPWLQRFGYPGVIFVPTGFIGGRNAFDADIWVEPEEPICTWEELRELEREGISVQSHGVTHRSFSTLTAAEQEAELTSSKVMLEAELGKRVDVFAFPYGDPGPDAAGSAAMLERVGYRAACLYGGGPARSPIAAPFQLPRIAVGPDTDLRAALEAHER